MDFSDNPPAKKRRTSAKVSATMRSVFNAVAADAKRLGSPSHHEEIDENLYSRQLYVLGHDAMRHIARSRVLISGLGGLGVEIAKNVILCGVKSVTLHDEIGCNTFDLSSQFYISEADNSVGKNRATACSQQLSKLNPHVHTKTYTGRLTDNIIRMFRVVVLTNSSLDEQLRISKITHSNNIALIIADTRGVFGQIFCDFGKEFTVVDVNGEDTVSAEVGCISKDTQGIVSCFEGTRHGLQDGDYVTFSDINGMVELNEREPVRIKVINAESFSIGDTSSYSDYTYGGVAKQVKMPKKLYFKPLNESINNPEYLISDNAKPDNPSTLHVAFQTLHKFIEVEGRRPRPWDNDDAAEFVTLAESVEVSDADRINSALLETFAKVCKGNLCPINSTIGGIAAQEVMKACSGKFHPIFQWFYFDATECLPDNVAEEDCQSIGRRTDGQTAVFGATFQNKLEAMNYFVVGAGAIGCELLKNFAMMGIGTNQGSVTVTDMDMIEKSNLNRQFLFHPKDVGKPKSLTAARAIKAMNPSLNIRADQCRVGPETENIYDDTFFENLDGVANALDNTDTRIYMDHRCIYHRKPLLESGTLGTKGSTQIIVPFFTESYSSSQDPPEKNIPICTLRNFPNSIEHTLQWARDNFEGLFKHSAENAAQYLSDPNFIERTLRLPHDQSIEILKSVKTALLDDRPRLFRDCVKWARNHWEQQFSNQIRQLLFNFPPDHLTDSGQPFWSGPKKCPEPLTFDVNDDLHLDYILAAANLKAEMYGIPQNRNREKVARLVGKVKVPQFSPKPDIKIPTSDSQVLNGSGSYYEDKIDELRRQLPFADYQSTNSSLKITPLEFDKDNDSNLHMDFIVAASNLRAANYKIPPADRHKSKLIAGKIIPAIATTTSVVAGLICIELIKLVQNCAIDKFRNSFVNLALPLFSFSEPLPAPKMKYNDREWTLWDRIEIDGEITLQEFINYFKEQYQLEITMLSQGVSMLYSFFMAPNKLEKRINLPMSEVVKEVSKKELEPHVKSIIFEVSCTDNNGTDVEVPYVRYTLPFQHRQQEA